MTTKLYLPTLLLIAVLMVLVGCGGGGGGEGGASYPSIPDTPTPTPTPTPPPPTPEPELVVEIVKGTGDYFDPVVIDVSYSEGPFTYEVPEGHVTETDSGLEIRSNGEVGEHTLLINDEEYRYSFEEPPVCQIDEEYVDCVGLQQRLGTTSFIWYGEDDTRIVEWTVAYIGRMAEAGEGVLPADARLQAEAEKVIDATNELYRQSGIYARLRLAEVWGTGTPNGGFVAYNRPEITKTDILAVSGASAGSGYAGMSSQFRDKAFPLRPYFPAGDARIFAHELGHTLGNGHGENNGVNPGAGTIFWFSQGADICGLSSDIMQYHGDASRKYHSNHTMTCKELTGRDDQYADDMAGSIDLSGTSTAYSINRVRYDVALLHNEYDKVPRVQVAEFVCQKTLNDDGTASDCYGYDYGPASQALAWAGPDDTRMAVIDLAMMRRGGTYGEVLARDHTDMVAFQSAVDEMNIINMNSGVYIHFNVVAGWYVGPDCNGVASVPRGLAKGIADLVVGICPSSGSGESYINRSFLPNSTPHAVASTMSSTTILHELGHAMGLGHGVWGNPNWSYAAGDTLEQGFGGSFFLAFSHGWGVYKSGEGICGFNAGSWMSYTKSKRLGWSNSERDCKEPGVFGYRRGSRDATDEAYHLNRVRWNVSRVSP